ncbi:MAG: hypothetical protein ACLVJH_17025 [Faecalibacterium prausnitzii]
MSGRLAAELFSQHDHADYEAETQQKRDRRSAGHKPTLDQPACRCRLRCASWEGELARANAPVRRTPSDLLRGQFRCPGRCTRQLPRRPPAAALEAAFDFMEQAFAESQEDGWCSSPNLR